MASSKHQLFGVQRAKRITICKSKTFVFERDIEEPDAESIARLERFPLLSSMVGRHDKP